ncbi:hypothetical protein GGX14DRAFT_453911 [Mycena pura]|uniref:Uncharacterized protein n=1 Tax=Mycena pura TaxID=153505 RepID=A0AAD6YC67_9AGAR|nr:hypothetical protein GGX14DRAFT_453911 [Mycena pura]
MPPTSPEHAINDSYLPQAELRDGTPTQAAPMANLDRTLPPCSAMPHNDLSFPSINADFPPVLDAGKLDGLANRGVPPIRELFPKLVHNSTAPATSVSEPEVVPARPFAPPTTLQPSADPFRATLPSNSPLRAAFRPLPDGLRTAYRYRAPRALLTPPDPAACGGPRACLAWLREQTPKTDRASGTAVGEDMEVDVQAVQRAPFVGSYHAVPPAPGAVASRAPGGPLAGTPRVYAVHDGGWRVYTCNPTAPLHGPTLSAATGPPGGFAPAHLSSQPPLVYAPWPRPAASRKRFKHPPPVFGPTHNWSSAASQVAPVQVEARAKRARSMSDNSGEGAGTGAGVLVEARPRKRVRRLGGAHGA